MFLETIETPDDLKKLSANVLPLLAQEIRQTIIETTSQNGGHVGSNLGLIELSIALHYVFNSPRDKFLFDVSHQTYTHKLLTGRNKEKWKKLRETDGLSGFSSPEESEHDSFYCGHAGTALSSALGLAAARDKIPELANQNIIAIVGDAALSNGTTLEALNNVSSHTKRLIIILNDNEWSIDKNVGAISEYLNQLITTSLYNKANQKIKNFFKKMPSGEKMIDLISSWKKGTKSALASKAASLFENLKIRYLGPIDGHDITQLISYLNFAKNCDSPILIHIKTTKGKGLKVAMNNQEKFHGCSPYDPKTGNPIHKLSDIPTWQQIFGERLLKMAQVNPKIVGITAAMPAGTGLNLLKKQCPEQYFDVGIAEEHAVVFSAGLAKQGFKPCVAIYSSFMQRAVDMMMHDICLQNANVLFCLDRSGLSPQDGATHHGLFDIAMLRALPNLTIMQPKDEDELCDMMYSAFEEKGPKIIRYPRGAAIGTKIKDVPQKIPFGKAEIINDGDPNTDICIWSFGPLLKTANAIADAFFEKIKIRPRIINARFVKPFDYELLSNQIKTIRFFITLEDHAEEGGFGSAFLEALSQKKHPGVIHTEIIGWPDKFIHHGTNAEILRKENHLSDTDICDRVLNKYDQFKN